MLFLITGKCITTYQLQAVAKMNPIRSICIPRIESIFDAHFIANVFDMNNLADVSYVYIEPYYNMNLYNRVYIGIKSWKDTEAAYHFIERLRNPSREARLVYCDDNWWPVIINNNINKLASNKRVLTVFQDKPMTNDDVAEIDELDEFVHIDAEKTKLLRNTIANFKVLTEDYELSQRQYRTKAMRKREDLLQELDETAEEFNGYLRDMYNDRELWFSEQYIYDELGM